MSDECQITGFDSEQQHRWPLVHQYLCEQLEFPDGSGLAPEALKQLTLDLESVLWIIAK